MVDDMCCGHDYWNKVFKNIKVVVYRTLYLVIQGSIFSSLDHAKLKNEIYLKTNYLISLNVVF